MATVTPIAVYNGDKTFTVTWTGIVTADTATPYNIKGNVSDITVFSSGTFAGGSSVSFRGSNDNTNFEAALVDVGGTAIAHTAADGSELRGGWAYISPVVASGAADAVDVTMFFRAA